MIIAYQYRLKPNRQQVIAIESWLEKLRHQYNYLLADRFDWWQNNRCYINSCPLTCGIAPLRDNPGYYLQKRSLVGLKESRPWYREIQSQVLQDMVKRVKLSFDRYIKGDSKGKRSGKPRFKGVGRYRTFTFPQIKPNCIEGNRINLPKLGAIKFVKHRQLPDSAKIKTASITRKADGYYLTLSLDIAVNAVPTLVEKVGAIDLGLIDFLVDSDGENIIVPKY